MIYLKSNWKAKTIWLTFPAGMFGQDDEGLERTNQAIKDAKKHVKKLCKNHGYICSAYVISSTNGGSKDPHIHALFVGTPADTLAETINEYITNLAKEFNRTGQHVNKKYPPAKKDRLALMAYCLAQEIKKSDYDNDSLGILPDSTENLKVQVNKLMKKLRRLDKHADYYSLVEAIKFGIFDKEAEIFEEQDQEYYSKNTDVTGDCGTFTETEKVVYG